MEEQGYSRGSCLVNFGELEDRACLLTLREEVRECSRLIEAAHLSRPEHYLSIYQSGCNLTCLKCHSWRFSRHAEGRWMVPRELGDMAREYRTHVTVIEPKERATSWHGAGLCRSCGNCVTLGQRSNYCPGRIGPDQVVLSPQGFGPARNIIAFTGGDLTCRPRFYLESAERIKAASDNLWVLLETNGFGLSPRNLDEYAFGGVDAFWLDIKARDEEVHRKLTGAGNRHILTLPEEITRRGFTLEVLSLYIPGWVETDQLREIGALLTRVNPDIPFTLLAFFPEYRLCDVPAPDFRQMREAYCAVRETGLRNVRLGNLGVFLKSGKDWENFERLADREAP